MNFIIFTTVKIYDKNNSIVTESEGVELNELYWKKKEIGKLNEIINVQSLKCSLIYGRRRVGKSELVNQVLKQSEYVSFYYECKQVAEGNNASSLSEIIEEALKLPKLGYKDMESVLELVFEMSKEKKMILVLDEYPYLKESVKGMDSILQTLIDKYRENSKLSLILLGSYVEIMKSLLEHSNPLYGRVDLTINLGQMDYYESSLFYPTFSNEDKVKLYSVFGGIPYYNRLIDERKSVKQNIIDLIASSGARLENEVSMYLNSEISKIANTNEVFEALSKGFAKYSDILSQSHVSSGPTLVDVLDKLIKMEVILKTSPINDSINKRKISYSISDNLSLFYYKYIFKHLSQLKIMDSEVFFKKYIEEDFESQFVPRSFERICSQYLIRKNLLGEIDPIIEKIGKYYYDDPKNHKNGEFDIVTEDELGYVFYETKFRSDPISKEMIEEEIEQVKNTGLNCYKYVFISKTGFESFAENRIELINIDELYSF